MVFMNYVSIDYWLFYYKFISIFSFPQLTALIIYSVVFCFEGFQFSSCLAGLSIYY